MSWSLFCFLHTFPVPSFWLRLIFVSSVQRTFSPQLHRLLFIWFFFSLLPSLAMLATETLYIAVNPLVDRETCTRTLWVSRFGLLGGDKGVFLNHAHEYPFFLKDSVANQFIWHFVVLLCANLFFFFFNPSAGFGTTAIFKKYLIDCCFFEPLLLFSWLAWSPLYASYWQGTPPQSKGQFSTLSQLWELLCAWTDFETTHSCPRNI